MEEVHAYLVYRREVTRTTVRALAAEIGISRTAVDTFYKRKVHPERIWPKLRGWYVTNQRAQPRSTGHRAHPIVLLIAALELIGDFPAQQRGKAVRSLAGWLREQYRESHTPESHVVKLLETVDESETAESIRQKINYRVPPPDRIDL